MTPKIIVLTPVKNEAWILNRFLKVTSLFADHIIIIDQNSTDGCLEIYQQYPKVTLLHNNSENYDEAQRQLILIAKAREIEKGPKILLALDADEILTADSFNSLGWKTMLKAAPGTILFFEKPDLYLNPFQSIRYDSLWPLGYVDDGVEHKPIKIHSIRIPQPEYAKKLFLNDVKIIHYALTRMDNQKSKMRFYSMMENILNKNNFLARRKVYTPDYNYKQNGTLKETPVNWFEGWENLGIDMKSIESGQNFWYDDEALKLLQIHGSRKFWLDKIWDKDWNGLLSLQLNSTKKIKQPPFVLKIVLIFIDHIYSFYRRLRN